MKIIPSPDQILPLVEEWVELLAQDRYEEAFELMEHPQQPEWTVDVLQQLVANYGSLEPRPNGKVFRVTSLSSVVQGQGPENPYRDVEWFSEKERKTSEHLGMVHFDVPLNGEHSDLTAIFWIKAHEEGLVLQLEDLHVL